MIIYRARVFDLPKEAKNSLKENLKEVNFGTITPFVKQYWNFFQKLTSSKEELLERINHNLYYGLYNK